MDVIDILLAKNIVNEGNNNDNSNFEQLQQDINQLGQAVSQLDTQFDNLGNIYASKDNEHTHTNKDILDRITSQDIENWDNKSDFSGSYNDLEDKPVIPIIDDTLTSAGNAADAKATGDIIQNLTNTKQNKPTLTTATETTATILPNTTYEYGEVSSLDLTLSDEVGSYEVIFESGITATVLSLTSSKSLLWHNEPIVLPNKVYTLAIEVGTEYARAVLSYAESVS